jgi:hypothetical protein
MSIEKLICEALEDSISKDIEQIEKIENEKYLTQGTLNNFMKELFEKPVYPKLSFEEYVKLLEE